MPTDCHGVVCEGVTGLDAHTRSAVDAVRRHGFQVTMAPADEHGPGWAYTTGLWHGRRVPGLAMFGLGVRLMHTLLDEAFVGTAIGCCRKSLFPFLQVVWPDRDGAFPWEPGGGQLLDRQPRLWLRPGEHPVGVL